MTIAAFFIVATVIFVICASFSLNPFRQTATQLMIYVFTGATCIAFVSLFLNVATNISLIADAKISEVKSANQNTKSAHKWFIGFAAFCILVGTFVVLSSIWSEKRQLEVVTTTAADVVEQNKEVITSIAGILAQKDNKHFLEISPKLNFIEKQRAGLPDLRLLYQGNFEGRPATYEIESYNYYSGPKKDEVYNPKYYSCEKGTDCEYLNDFFAGRINNKLKNYQRHKDEYSVYIPVVEGKARFILLFKKYERYGKVGSY